MQLFQLKGTIKILQSKLFFWSVSPALILGISTMVYFTSIEDYSVFPNQQSFDYQFYSDNAAGGNSKILKQVVTDSIIKLDYQIGNKLNAQYAGLTVGPKGRKPLNLDCYNELTIKIKGIEVNGIGIALVTENLLKGKDEKHQEILFYHIFKISEGVHTYKINTDKFKIPDWWGENNRIEEASIIKPDLRNMKAINISGAYTPNTGKTQSIEIYSIHFSRNNRPLISLIVGLEIIFILIVFIVLLVVENTRAKKKTITITYQAIEVKNSETAKSDFIDFINTHFQNSELTLDLVSRETGVSQRRITNEIQHQFSCNFKTYINRIRIQESKRLLLDKDLIIGEIAFIVGFNNQSHFNRVFKSELQLSPTEYRDQHRI